MNRFLFISAFTSIWEDSPEAVCNEAAVRIPADSRGLPILCAPHPQKDLHKANQSEKERHHKFHLITSLCIMLRQEAAAYVNRT